MSNYSDEKSETDLSSAFESENPIGKRYMLHRIEEESEAEEPIVHMSKSRTADSVGSALSMEAGSIMDSECNLVMRRNGNNGRLLIENEIKEGLI